MSAYLGVAVGFAALGCYTFALFRWWYKRLTSLAARFDLSERRKRASWQALPVMLLFAVPALVVLVISMIHRSVSGFFIVAAFILVMAPTVVWYLRQIPKLRALVTIEVSGEMNEES